VVQRRDGIRTLLTNGKFQGNDGGEVRAQLRFSQTPMLVHHGYDRALLIGVGTGCSLGALASQPFKAVEAIDLSRDILEASRRFFGHVNDHILDSTRAQVTFADGRNYLLLSDRRYDLVTIELTSIWFAGAADLYNREFYRLVGEHLAPSGVVQQWVQLHHMTRRDLAVILQSLRAELPHVALFIGGSQGQVLASREPLSLDYRDLVALSGRLRGTLATRGVFEDDLLTIAGELALDEEGVDRLIREEAELAHVAPERLLSTDDNMRLEYSTPRNNALSGEASRSLIPSLTPLVPTPLPVSDADVPGAGDHLLGARLIGAGQLREAETPLARAAPENPAAARLLAGLRSQLALLPSAATP
jgi:spermidine synthase